MSVHFAEPSSKQPLSHPLQDIPDGHPVGVDLDVPEAGIAQSLREIRPAVPSVVTDCLVPWTEAVLVCRHREEDDAAGPHPPRP